MSLEHSIAGYEFIEIQGSLNGRARQLEVIARKGQDDVTIRQTATRGRPITVRTVNYVSNFTGAVTAIDSYTELQDGNSYPVVQYGVDLGDWYVLQVREVSRQYVTNVIGGRVGGETCFHVCEWQLLHVTPAPSP